MATPDVAPASSTTNMVMDPAARSQVLAWPGRRWRSKQRRDLRHLQRAEKHRAVDETQRKCPRLLAFEHRFLAERVDARGDADIGVLLDHLAEPGNGAIERAHQIVQILGLDAWRYAIEGF